MVRRLNRKKKEKRVKMMGMENNGRHISLLPKKVFSVGLLDILHITLMNKHLLTSTKISYILWQQWN